MDDARMDQLLRELDEQPLVRAEFAAALRDRLVADLERSRGRRRRFGIAVPGSWTTTRPALRVAWMVAVVALLAAAMAGVLGVATRLLTPDADELVRLSRAASAEPPAFSATVRDPSGSVYRVSSDGAGTWRTETLESPEGSNPASYDLYDGSRIGRYDATGRLWTTGSLADWGGVPPFPVATELTWKRIEIGADRRPIVIDAGCDGAELLEPGSVANRAADHVRCLETGMEVWLDRDSHLILRFQAGAQTPGWEPGTGLEVTAFSIGAPADSTAFSFDGPRDASTPDDQPPSHTLESGDAMPALSGPLVGGGTFDTSSLAGRPVALFVWCPCVQGPELRVFAEAVAGRADRLEAVAVLEATDAEAAALVEDVAFAGPALVDETGVIDPLGLNYWPVLVLVDKGGHIASLSRQVGDPAELDAMLDALLAGEPIPSPTWVVRPGNEEASTVLEIGREAPEWAVPAPDGTTLAVDDLAGMRTIVYYGLPHNADDYTAQNEAMLRDLDAARRADPDLRVVLVLAQAATRDAAQASLDALGIDLPLVADRDGIIGSAWGLAYYPSLVFLDESGRVAGYGAGACLDTQELVRAFRDGAAMPAPEIVLSGPDCP